MARPADDRRPKEELGDELEVIVNDLAAVFYTRVEQLDAGDEPWGHLSEVDREFYRQGIKAVLLQGGLSRAIELRRKLCGG
jgi:hypothetical protein